MLLDPAVVRRHVVRDEVEHEPQPAPAQAFTQAGEGFVSAEVGVHVIVADGEAGPADVSLLEVRQDPVIFRQPLRIRRRDTARGLAGLPHAEEPDQVEPVLGEPV